MTGVRLHGLHGYYSRSFPWELFKTLKLGSGLAVACLRKPGYQKVIGSLDCFWNSSIKGSQGGHKDSSRTCRDGKLHEYNFLKTLQRAVMQELKSTDTNNESIY